MSRCLLLHFIEVGIEIFYLLLMHCEHLYRNVTRCCCRCSCVYRKNVYLEHDDLSSSHILPIPLSNPSSLLIVESGSITSGRNVLIQVCHFYTPSISIQGGGNWDRNPKLLNYLVAVETPELFISVQYPEMNSPGESQLFRAINPSQIPLWHISFRKLLTVWI